MRVAVGITISGAPEQMETVDEALEAIGREQPTWSIEIGRAATSRIVQVRLIARGLDEAVAAVRKELRQEAGSPLGHRAVDIHWARPRQIQM